MMDIVFFISIGFLLVGIILSVSLLKKDIEVSKLAIILYLSITFITEISGNIIARFYHHNNIALYNLYMPLEFLLMNRILSKICSRYFNYKIFFLAGSFVFFSSYLIETLLAGNFQQYNSFSSSIALAYFGIVCCYYYYTFLKRDSDINILKDFGFWMVTGWFLYSFCTIIFTLFFKYIVEIYKQNEMNRGIYIITIVLNIFNFILYCCWSYAFICKYREKISSSSSFV